MELSADFLSLGRGSVINSKHKKHKIIRNTIDAQLHTQKA